MRRNSKKWYMVEVRCQFVKLSDLSGYSEKSNIQEAYMPKTSISGQIVSEILAQLRSDDSIQILLKKQFSIFLSHIRLQKQHSSLMYWLKICKAWVRSQLRWAWNWLKLNVTYEFECFEDNHSLTISTQARINTKKFIVLYQRNIVFTEL